MVEAKNQPMQLVDSDNLEDAKLWKLAKTEGYLKWRAQNLPLLEK